MRVRMLATQMGAVDDRGLDVQLHSAGEVYDLPHELAQVYLDQGWAEEDKSIARAPETKVKDDVEQPEGEQSEGESEGESETTGDAPQASPRRRRTK